MKNIRAPLNQGPFISLQPGLNYVNCPQKVKMDMLNIFLRALKLREITAIFSFYWKHQDRKAPFSNSFASQSKDLHIS